MLSLAIYIPSFSQLQFGFKSGLNLSTISNVSYGSDYNRTAYFNIGITTRLNLSRRFYFSPQLLFSEKGTSLLLIPSGTMRMHLNYLSMPLYFGFKLTKAIAIQAGPEIAYLIIANDKSSGSSSNDVTDLHNRWELGLSTGLNIQLGKQLFSELLFNYGLTNVRPSYSASFPATGRNNLLQINLGYYFKRNAGSFIQ